MTMWRTGAGMKKVGHVLLWLTVMFLCACSSETGQSQKDVNKQPALAPDFELGSLQGQTVRLSELRGKVVVLNFWATWCPPCREEVPSMQQLHDMMSGTEFVMLAVNIEQDGRKTVPVFLQKNPVDFTILFDESGQVRKSYGVAKYPETFIIDPQGRIVEKVIGGINWSQPRVVEFMRHLLPESAD
ncbi:TlpA disulfide reductase family protein [uncultured Desulfuromonas sp.]|uniref:TlpA disulfide reductase family protein n=1 Tax=uncultured Desulfuromonas sp. TaxID=181013 RepID=UPI002AAB612E|nr:TlpA disulfide reductase family protein [uncultured Desulfuromonas sp.]